MDSFVATLVGSFVGASAAIGAGPLLESYKRHRDRSGTASAIAGEIAAIIDISIKRKHAEGFASFLVPLKKGTDVKIGNIVGFNKDALDPIIESHIGKLGLLPSSLSRKIAAFYTYLQGIRIDLLRLASDEFDGDPSSKAQIIEEDLALWKQTVDLGNSIIQELDKVSSEKWWLVAILCKAFTWHN
jgi:hypothetical protein